MPRDALELGIGTKDLSRDRQGLLDRGREPLMQRQQELLQRADQAARYTPTPTRRQPTEQKREIIRQSPQYAQIRQQEAQKPSQRPQKPAKSLQRPQQTPKTPAPEASYRPEQPIPARPQPAPQPAPPQHQQMAITPEQIREMVDAGMITKQDGSALSKKEVRQLEQMAREGQLMAETPAPAPEQATLTQDPDTQYTQRQQHAAPPRALRQGPSMPMPQPQPAAQPSAQRADPRALQRDAPPSLKEQDRQLREIVSMIAEKEQVPEHEVYAQLAAESMDQPPVAKQLLEQAGQSYLDAAKKDRSLLEHPEQGRFLDIVAKLQKKAGDHRGAADTYSKSYSLNRDPADLVKRGDALIRGGEKEEGVKALMSALPKMDRGDENYMLAKQTLDETLAEDAPERAALEQQEITDYDKAFCDFADELTEGYLEFRRVMQRAYFAGMASLADVDWDKVQGPEKTRDVLDGFVYRFIQPMQASGFIHEAEDMSDTELKELASGLISWVDRAYKIDFSDEALSVMCSVSDAPELTRKLYGFVRERYEEVFQQEVIAKHICVGDDAELESFSREAYRSAGVTPTPEMVDTGKRKLAEIVLNSRVN